MKISCNKSNNNSNSSKKTESFSSCSFFSLLLLLVVSFPTAELANVEVHFVRRIYSELAERMKEKINSSSNCRTHGTTRITMKNHDPSLHFGVSRPKLLVSIETCSTSVLLDSIFSFLKNSSSFVSQPSLVSSHSFGLAALYSSM